MQLPTLHDLLLWLSKMPETFRELPAGFSSQDKKIRDSLSDQIKALCAEDADEDFLQAFEPAADSIRERNRFAWVLATSHLLTHQAFQIEKLSKEALQEFFSQELSQLSAIVSIDMFFAKEERREELLRRVLRAIKQSLPEEDEATAISRLMQLDSIAERKLLTERADKKKQKEIEDEIRRKEAEEAASKYNRE